MRHKLTPERVAKALATTDGNVTRAAVVLGVHRTALQRAMRRYELEANEAPVAHEIDVLDPDRIREDQERAERQHLRRENEKLRKELAKREEIVDRILEAARLPVETPDYELAEPRPDLPVRSAVLPIYDLQYGQFVRPTDVPLHRGGYDSEGIFDERLARWLRAVTSSMRDYAASHYVEELVLALGGDLVEGADIFAGHAWQLDKDPALQARTLAEKLAKALRMLIRFSKEQLGVQRIGVFAVPGNHGKVGGKRAGAIPSTFSFDWLTVEFLELLLREEPIDLWVNEPSSWLLFETAGHTFLQVHGDEVKGHTGIPYYGLTKFDGRAIRLSRVVYDYCLLGHHHQQSSIPNGSGGEFLMSGDWVGGNNLSKYIVAASRPQQRLIFVSRKFGVTEPIPIYLTDSAAREEPLIYRMEEAA